MILTNPLSFNLGSTADVHWQDGGQWMSGVIVEGNSTDCDWQSYIVKVTKIGTFITQNTRHIHKTPLTAKQHFQEKLSKGTEWPEDIFIDTNLIEHNRLFKLYAAGTQVNIYYHDKQQENNAVQQMEMVDDRTYMSDGRQDHDIEGDIPKTEIMIRSQNSRSSEIRTRPERISHRAQRLGIDQQ